MGTELVLCYHKLVKTAAPPGGPSATAAVEAAIASKMGRMLAFLNCEYDDPSRSVIDFAREYVQVSRQHGMAGIVQGLCAVIIGAVWFVAVE